ncbi:hypothetical protein R3X27_24790 [Tropicimonas sp. TH_r6]|nr:hypothetical protein [Tropicimonas sp. TH_r6]MDV7145908.1 hypothetical protein [Tropicimonas sp. TH_r6]
MKCRDKASRTGKSAGATPGDDRQARLKQALKANLARRKVQARARATEAMLDTELKTEQTGRDTAGEAEQDG